MFHWCRRNTALKIAAKRSKSYSEIEAAFHAAMDQTTDHQRIKRFYSLQEERVQTYDMFEEGFQAYLAGAPQYNFELYKKLVHEITSTFKNISDEILQLQEKLAGSHANVAAVISKIQDAEKEKLESTAKLQIATQNAKDHPGADEYQDECEQLKQKGNECRTSIYELMEEFKYESEDIVGDS